MNVNLPPASLGAVLALVVFVLAVVFAAIGQVDALRVFGLIALLAVARLT